MINEESITKLYETIISGNELTTKELNNMGFNSKDIKELIEQGNLQRIKRGYYSFLSIDDLFMHGKSLIAKKEYDKATLCFKKCYELDPNHSSSCFQLFLRSINEKDYEEAFKYFDVIFKTENKFYSNDSNFYLYLLSIITDVPEKHKEYARFLKIEDIRVDFEDKRYKDIPQQNKVRIAVLQRKFPYALKQLKDLTIKHGFSTVQDIITKTLLLQAIEVETKNKNTLIEFSYNREYEKIVEFLNEKQKRHDLSLNDRYILILVTALLEILEKENIPEKKIFQADKIFEAIDGCNYELALQLSEEYNAKNNINNNENAIYLLLYDICESIKKLNSKQTDLEESTPEIEEVVENTIVEEEPVSFTDIIRYLLQKDLENAFRTLRKYLDSINKRDYEFLVVDLIKISLIENDVAFTKPMISLTYLTRNSFVFDISLYIQDFYVALSQNKFDIARIYLDILMNAKNLGINCEFVSDLLQVLNNTEQLLDSKITKDEVIRPEENESKIEENTKLKVPIASIKEEKVNKTIEVKDSEKEFIENKHQQLLTEQGIIILRAMDNERRKNIHRIVKTYPDMVSFSIGEGDKRQIVLRYKPNIDEYVDIKNLVMMGNIAYKNGDYDSCISDYLQLLQFGTPKAFVYAKLGLAYMKKWNIDLSVNYLYIATELSKNEDRKYDFTELIASLRGEIDESDKKPRFKMKSEDFANDTDNYGIDNFDNITTYMLETGLDVESACLQLGYSLEEIDIIKLIYAREYYSQGDFEKGDQFLKSVEMSNNKTKLTKRIFEEVRTNKKFYMNRTRDNIQRLSLALKVKKGK